MKDLLFQLTLIAQDTQAGAQGDAAAPGGSPLAFMLPVALILMLGYFMLVRPEKKKQATHREMLQNLKKNDKVITVGGIKGSVANVLRDTGEVVVLVDESTGTKMRMTLDSIARVDMPKYESTDGDKK